MMMLDARCLYGYFLHLGPCYSTSRITRPLDRWTVVGGAYTCRCPANRHVHPIHWPSAVPIAGGYKSPGPAYQISPAWLPVQLLQYCPLGPSPRDNGGGCAVASLGTLGVYLTRRASPSRPRETELDYFSVSLHWHCIFLVCNRKGCFSFLSSLCNS